MVFSIVVESEIIACSCQEERWKLTGLSCNKLLLHLRSWGRKMDYCRCCRDEKGNQVVVDGRKLTHYRGNWTMLKVCRCFVEGEAELGCCSVGKGCQRRWRGLPVLVL